MAEDLISLNEAARIAGVAPSTLQRWARMGVIPVKRGRWTTAAAAQARVVGRMRERGHSLAELRRAVREGRLAFGYVEDLLPGRARALTREQAAEHAGLEEALIERIMALLGTPTAIEGTLNEQDAVAMERIADVLRAGFPLVALLQLIRVYAQSIRKIAEAEVRLFHLYVHEPLIRQGVDALQMAEEMEGLARDLLPLTSPLMEYIHQRYLRFYIEQDVVGHMEAELGGQRQLGRVQMAFCFVDLTGFTRYTEEEGDEEAFDLVERFVETVEATLPAEAMIVKTIGDEVMIVSPDPVTLTGVGGRLPDVVPGTPPAAGGRALRARGLPRRRLLRHRGQPDPPGGRPRPGRRGDGHDGGRRCDRQVRLPRVRPDRRGRAEGLSRAGGAVRGASPEADGRSTVTDE